MYPGNSSSQMESIFLFTAKCEPRGVGANQGVALPGANYSVILFMVTTLLPQQAKEVKSGWLEATLSSASRGILNSILQLRGHSKKEINCILASIFLAKSFTTKEKSMPSNIIGFSRFHTVINLIFPFYFSIAGPNLFGDLTCLFVLF